MPTVARRASSPRSPRRRRRSNRSSWIDSPQRLGMALAIVFVTFWILTVGYTSMTLLTTSTTRARPNASSLPHLMVPRPVIEQQQQPQEDKNPYFGWQPAIPAEMACSWRACFKPEHSCATCRDSLEDFGPAPPAPADWVPDVTMLARMRKLGHDEHGHPWPPPLQDQPELCEPIGGNGGKNDINKECKYFPTQMPRFFEPFAVYRR